ncbi:MAG: hypothetical protein ABL973_00020 [Micropepsaceae bacterium]
MLNDKKTTRKMVLGRSLAAVVASAQLTGCAMHEGGSKMKMGAMQENPMHQMMQAMGCEHTPTQMQAMEMMTSEQKQTHMRSHIAECNAKMRQEATDAALAKIDSCIQEQMSSRHVKRMNKKEMHAMMMAKMRACAKQGQPEAVQPTKPSTHDGH